MPPSAGFAATMRFYRGELERRRALLETIVCWYLLPLFAGPLVLFIGTALTRPRGFEFVAFPLGGFITIAALIARMNRAAARGLRERIDALAALEERS